MKKKEIVRLLEGFHEELKGFNQKVQKLEGNGDCPIQEGWATVVDKFKELEERDANQRQGIQSLLRRIETLEIQFKEKTTRVRKRKS